MAEIGRILYLPPPAAPGRPAPIQGGGTDPGRHPAGAAQQVDAAAAAEDAAGQPNQTRAKHFRFRVYDGGRPDEALAGNAGVPAGESGPARGRAAAGTRDDAAAARLRARGPDGTGHAAGSPGGGDLPAGGFSAPFLAQLIAQERLRPGLHHPPLTAADRAYRQAGGEPAWGDGGAPRFRMAL